MTLLRLLVVFTLALPIGAYAEDAYPLRQPASSGLPTPSFPGDLTPAADWLYFTAQSGPPYTADRKSLWRTDGTPEGTVELMPTPGGAYVAVGRSLLFYNRAAHDELWITDGSVTGTRRATEFASRFAGPLSIKLAVNDVVFVAADGWTWATRVAPGSPVIRLLRGTEHRFLQFGDRVLLGSEAETISTDGTAEGTYPLELWQGFSLPFGSTIVMGGHLYVAAAVDKGVALWKADGSPEGTVKLATVPPGFSSLAAAGRNLFLSAGHTLWVSDGTAEGTRQLPAEPIGPLMAVGDHVFFKGGHIPGNPLGAELWGSDGTPEGTHLVRDIWPGYVSSELDREYSTGDRVYFAARTQEYGTELWTSDGTPDGTKLVVNVGVATEHGSPGLPVHAGERLFFSATAIGIPRQLWVVPLPGSRRVVVDGTRTPEGRVAQFRVTLSSAAPQPVSVDYTTTDESAKSGADYVGVSGTLTFAPGETVKRIDVVTSDDFVFEANETLSVTLRNAVGATLERAMAFGTIDDDDRHADLGLALDFSMATFPYVGIATVNRGPSTATAVRYVRTATPVVFTESCLICPAAPEELASGETALQAGRAFSPVQQYFTWTVDAHEPDPRSADNVARWTASSTMAMDALYLNPGQNATIWYYPGGTSDVRVETSDPAVLSVPATLSIAPQQRAVSFVVRATAVGTTTVRIITSTGLAGTLNVLVVPAGTRVRWPGGVAVLKFPDDERLTKMYGISVDTVATAPFTGRTATGLVTIRLKGREVGRITLPAASDRSFAQFYLADVGPNEITVDYSGDENFLPSTRTVTARAVRGLAQIFGSIDRNGSGVTLIVDVRGVPLAVPTGTITVKEVDVVGPTIEAKLMPTASGGMQARVVLPASKTGSRMFYITYSGDTRYEPGERVVRVRPKSRAARH